MLPPARRELASWQGWSLRYCCKNGERVKKIHMNAERCIADNARIPSNAFHPMQCEAGGRVLHWMQCITRDVCNISNTPRGMNVYFLYSRAILAAKTLLLKIGMNKRRKSRCKEVFMYHTFISRFFSKKWCIESITSIFRKKWCIESITSRFVNEMVTWHHKSGCNDFITSTFPRMYQILHQAPVI